MAKYCKEHVCVCMCVCPFASISPESHARSYQNFVHVAYGRGGKEIPRGRGNFVVFPTDNALYSIAFGTHTKTAELIEMPFEMMTGVGPSYRVLDGYPIAQGEGAIFWGKGWAVQKRLNWLRCRFGWRLGCPKEPCIRWRCGSPRERAICGSCSGHSKALAISTAAVATAFAAKGIIQSPITSCTRRDHSVCQARADSIRKIPGRGRCGLLAAKGAVGSHSAGDVWHLRLPCFISA